MCTPPPTTAPQLHPLQLKKEQLSGRENMAEYHAFTTPQTISFTWVCSVSLLPDRPPLCNCLIMALPFYKSFLQCIHMACRKMVSTTHCCMPFVRAGFPFLARTWISKNKALMLIGSGMSLLKTSVCFVVSSLLHHSLSGCPGLLSFYFFDLKTPEESNIDCQLRKLKSKPDGETCISRTV